MSELLAYSFFQDVLFPKDLDQNADSQNAAELRLEKVIRLSLEGHLKIEDIPMVIFDFETTGLDSRDDEIIEIGAIKIINFKPVAEFHSLIKPSIALPEMVTKITGLTEADLEGQPAIATILPKILDFIQGSLLVAHNAEFDMSFLQAACRKLGYQINWPCFCTLKMARTLLASLESKNLDKLAEYYSLSFEARHRSIGDVKVTSEVLRNMLEREGKDLFKTWQDLQAFAVLKD